MTLDLTTTVTRTTTIWTDVTIDCATATGDPICSATDGMVDLGTAYATETATVDSPDAAGPTAMPHYKFRRHGVHFLPDNVDEML
jgi:hypothetical protein